MAIKIKEDLIPEEALYENLDMDSDKAKELLEWLVSEHEKALIAHADYFDELKVFRRAIAAKPTVKVKTFPWPGCSNIVVPLIRIAGDAVKARIINTLLAPSPFWVVKSDNGTMSEYVKPLERFMEWAAREDLDLVNTVEAIGDQVVYLGKCPMRICWEETIRKVMTYNTKTKRREHKFKTIKDSPTIKPILLENWLEPWGLEPSNQKDWNSERVFYSLSRLKELQIEKKIQNVSKIEEVIMTRLPGDILEAAELKKQSWANTEVATLYQTCFLYDYDGDGYREEMVALWSLEGPSLLSLKFNYFFHGCRPLELAYYLRDGFDRSKGDGIAQLLWALQDAMSTFVNQRTDNITLANTRTFKGKKGEIKKNGANSQIYPGSVMLMADPEHDLMSMEMGTVTPQSFQHESVLRDYAERLSGVSDPQLGREFNNPRVAATTTLSVLQEGNRRFDLAIRLLREVYKTVGMRVFQLYQQFGPRMPLEDILSPEDQVKVGELLAMSPEQIEKGMTLNLNTSTATSNKETQRQGLLALHQLIVTFYGQVIDVGMKVMINPQIPDSIKDMIVDMSQASYNTIKEIVQTYDINDPATFLVDVAESLNFIRNGGDAGGVEQQIGAGLDEFRRMAGGGQGAIPGANPSPIPQPGGIPNQAQLAQGAAPTPNGAGGGGGGVAVA